MFAYTRVDMKNNKTQWTAIRRNRQYLPTELTGDREKVAKQLEDIIKAHTSNSWVEAATDQIDVYLNRRKVAIYMP
jgi:hypothetical protein